MRDLHRLACRSRVGGAGERIRQRPRGAFALDGEVVPVVRIMGVECGVQSSQIAHDITGPKFGRRVAISTASSACPPTWPAPSSSTTTPVGTERWRTVCIGPGIANHHRIGPKGTTPGPWVCTGERATTARPQNSSCRPRFDETQPAKRAWRANMTKPQSVEQLGQVTPESAW